MKELTDGLGKPQILKVDEFEEDNVLSTTYSSLKFVPKLTQEFFLQEHDTIMLQCERDKVFLMVDEVERVDWITMTFGTIQLFQLLTVFRTVV